MTQSRVKMAEVISKLVERGMKAGMAHSTLIDTIIEIMPFDANRAVNAGDLRGMTKALGLSFGDRACLALDIGVEVLLIRGEI